MEIAKKEKDDVMVVSFIGRLDAASAVETEDELNNVIEGSKKLIVDLSGLEYISSAGLRVLLVAAKRMRRESGKLCLCALKDSVYEVFEISGFSAIFDLADTEDEAFGILND